MIIIKDIRHKHQVRAKELFRIEDTVSREVAFEEFAVSLVEKWDYTGEDGKILPIEPASFAELKIADIDELSETISEVLFPPAVKKTSNSKSPSTSTPSKRTKRGRGKSQNGLMIGSSHVGQV